MKGRVISLRQLQPDSETLSDEAVAEACRSGDPVAVAELFDRFHGSVVRFLSHLLRAREDVEDSLQSTFLEVARGRARFDGRSAVRTWLLAVAANVARNQLRKTRRQTRLQLALSREDGGSAHPPPDGRVGAKLQLERARRVLDGLPAEQRAAFVLCAVEGLSARETAQALGSTETAIWKRVSEARKAILAAARREET